MRKRRRQPDLNRFPSKGVVETQRQTPNPNSQRISLAMEFPGNFGGKGTHGSRTDPVRWQEDVSAVDPSEMDPDHAKKSD